MCTLAAMKHLHFEILILVTTVSVTVATIDSFVDNSTDWTYEQKVTHETASTLRTAKPNYEFVDPVSSLKYPQNISEYTSDKCYPWMYYNQNHDKCECSKIPYCAVLCDAEISRTSILDCYCMTHDNGTNQTYLGRCLYGCGHRIDTVYYKLPNNTDGLNNYSCGKYNRDSILCGDCLPGFSPLLYSYDMKCANCTGQNMTYNWIKYIAVAYVPLTIFFFLVVIFNFNGTSPLFKSLITISQGMSSPIAVRAFLSVVTKKNYIEIFIRLISCFYGIWNLDFFRTVLPPICMTNMTHLQVLSLDYAIAFYPLVLILIVYIFIRMHSRDVGIIIWIWRPFCRLFKYFKKNWDLEGSIVKCFATFFLLSYLKIISVTFDLIIYTETFVLNINSKEFTIQSSLYYDGSVEYFGRKHLPFAILALLIGIFVGIIPLLFVVLYPMKWFQKCLNALKIQRPALETFVNCYQGYYKDGTNDTKDYRWFSIMFFIFQLGMFTLFMIARSFYCYTLGTLAIMLLLFLHLSLQPYKEEFKIYNITDSLLLLIFGSWFIMILAGEEADIKAVYFSNFSYLCVAIISLLPLVYFIVVGVWWLLIRKNLKSFCKCKLLQFRGKQDRFRPESLEDNPFPHRLDNPTDYTNANTPLLSRSHPKPSVAVPA